MDYIDLRECNEVAGETFDLPSVETTARAGNSTADEALFKVYPVLDNGFVRLVDYMGGDHSIVRAARVSYGQGTKSVSDGKGLIDYLIRHRHTSPLEFVDLAFQVRCPIFVMRQWIRHRTACLTGDDILYFDLPSAIDNGTRQRHNMSIEEFYNKWHNGAHHSSGNHKKIRMCNEDSGEIEHTNVVDIWQNGIKPVFRVTLENGYSTKMTKDHLCMTKDGWLTLEQSTGVKVNKNENGVTWNFSPEFAINGAYKVAQLVRSYSKLEKIEFAGYEMTYDLEVAGPYHNFVCDGFIVHNSVNEYSGRYSEMKDIAYFPDPEQVLAQSQTNKQGRDGELDLEVVTEYINKLKDAWHDSYEDYQSFLESDITRELARIGLPLNICTEFYWKMNLHNLMHFLKLRADSHAQYEIRVYAEAMAEIAKEVAPMAMASWENHVKNGMGISANEREFIANGIRVTHQTGIFTDGFLDAMAAMVVEMKWSRPRTREVMIKIADIRGEPHDVWVGKYLDRVVKPAVQK